MRQALLRALRAAHLIQAADYFAARAAAFRARKENAAYRAAHPGRVFPDPALVFEVAGHASLTTFDQTGALHAKLIADLMRDADVQPGARILDWGCGPGRVLAHLPALRNDARASYVGCDPLASAIRHAQRAIPGVTFTRIRTNPPTPYPPASFDALYGISILTHMPEATARAWIAELARLIADSGVAIVSSHGEAAARGLTADERTQFDAGAYVVRGGASSGSRTYVSYFNETAGRRLFEAAFGDVIYRPSPEGGLGHDFWLLRHPRR